MPKKVDVTDWLEAYSQVSTNELIDRLERVIAVAAEKQEKKSKKQEEEKQEKKSKKQEEEKHLASIPSKSQSEIADYLAEKFQGKLTWNTDLGTVKLSGG